MTLPTRRRERPDDELLFPMGQRRDVARTPVAAAGAASKKSGAAERLPFHGLAALAARPALRRSTLVEFVSGERRTPRKAWTAKFCAEDVIRFAGQPAERLTCIFIRSTRDSCSGVRQQSRENYARVVVVVLLIESNAPCASLRTVNARGAFLPRIRYKRLRALNRRPRSMERR